MIVDNGVYQLVFDKSTGAIKQATNLESNVSVPLTIEWGWYNSSVGGCTAGIAPPKSEVSCSQQKSGA